jgi:hypothetical protein
MSKPSNEDEASLVGYVAASFGNRMLGTPHVATKDAARPATVLLSRARTVHASATNDVATSAAPSKRLMRRPLAVAAALALKSALVAVSL